MISLLLFIAVFLSLSSCLTSVSVVEYEQLLRATLLTGIDKEVPPASSGPVSVSLGVNIYKIQDISLSTGMMEINMWFRMVSSRRPTTSVDRSLIFVSVQ